MIKVSVIVPTYATPPDGLRRLVASLDRQTLATDEFEIIFVDDGSPDGTIDRLRDVQSTRPHVRIEQIENSGWPSKPRNVGTSVARGEYIAYMDHDDELYPDALRGAYEFAKAHGSDVVNGKEAYTHTPNWALKTYTGDLPQVIGRRDQHPLIPMNPHKLYRAAFLRDHDIRFPEGRKVMWEDAFFNLQVARHAEVISTLSSVPYYHWVVTPGSGSTTFLKWAEDYWTMLRRVLEATESELAGSALEPQRMQLLRHQYEARVVGVFDQKFMKRPEEARVFLFDHARALQTDFGLTRFDDQLSSSRRIRAHLLAANDRARLEQVCREDVPITGWSRALSLGWRNGILQVEAEADWSEKDGRRHALEREADRILKRFSPAVTSGVPDEYRDVTSEVTDATVQLSVRSRSSRIVWHTDSSREMTIADAPDGGVQISGRLVGTIDPMSAAFGSRLNSTHWDILVLTAAMNSVNHRNMLSDIPASLTITDGHLHIVYPNDGGYATVIPDGHREAVRRLSPVSAVSTESDEIVITLDGDHDGSGVVDTVAGLDETVDGDGDFQDVPATIRVADGVATLTLRPPASTFRLRVGDRTASRPTAWRVRVTDTGVDLDPELPPPPPTPPTPREPAPRSTTDASQGDRPLFARIKRRAGRTLRRWGLR